MLIAALVCMMSMQATTVAVTPNGDVCSVTVDGTTYDNLPVTTVDDIHLVAINREGISLLVRYTDTNTVSAIGTVNGEPVNYASDTVAGYAKTFQIPHSDFEEWHSVGNDCEEPGPASNNPSETTYSWHGFGTCFGGLAGSARTLSKLYSADHNEGKCAVVEAKPFKLFGLTVAMANGTMTTGRLKAGSSTASDSENHSEMDITKNYSSLASNQHNDGLDVYGPFYALLYAKPDAIKASMKVDLSQSSDKASISAAITDGTYYQEPAPSNTTYSNVAAIAKNTSLPTQDWTDYTFPFTYNEGKDAKAIMVTISTNANPGSGTDGDKVYVDDVELIYNASISNIALNGVTLEGFSFDAATTNYDITYSGEVMNLTADNFVVSTEGVSAIVVKNVENLGCGNYRIAIGVTSPDFKNGGLYTINLTHNPLTGKLYVLGDVNGKGWHANDAVEMTAANEDQTVFTAEISTTGTSNYFNFTTKLAEDDNDGGWAYILPYRIGAPGEGTDASVEISSTDLGTALPLGDWGKTRAYMLPAGLWKFTVDLTARTLTVVERMPDHLYILGDVNGKGWHANDGVEMSANEAHTVFTATEVTTAGENNYFRFTSELAENDDDGGWNYILPYNIGAPNANQQITTTDYGTALPLGDWGQANNFVLPAGKWNFSLDMEARTLTVSKAQEYLRGDVNCDGVVDVGDVNIMVNIILGKDTNDYEGRADLNGDNIVDVGDVNELVNIILGKN